MGTQGNFEGFVVPEASARVDADQFITADADHFQTCQPESRFSSSFKHLKDFVSGILNKVFANYCTSKQSCPLYNRAKPRQRMKVKEKLQIHLTTVWIF
jgi:hypothetical protein